MKVKITLTVHAVLESEDEYDARVCALGLLGIEAVEHQQAMEAGVSEYAGILDSYESAGYTIKVEEVPA